MYWNRGFWHGLATLLGCYSRIKIRYSSTSSDSPYTTCYLQLLPPLPKSLSLTITSSPFLLVFATSRFDKSTSPAYFSPKTATHSVAILKFNHVQYKHSTIICTSCQRIRPTANHCTIPRGMCRIALMASHWTMQSSRSSASVLLRYRLRGCEFGSWVAMISPVHGEEEMMDKWETDLFYNTRLHEWER